MVDDGSCIIGGCLDSRLRNFDPLANYDDGSCEPIVLGCSDARAVNFRPAANVLFACEYAGCMDHTATNFEPTATLPGPCIVPARGCTVPAAANYHSAAHADDGSCVFPGCMDSSRPNYDATATVESGCAVDIPGCTNPLAHNYDAAFNIDDGSCSIPGCTDPSNQNFKEAATFDDGTCVASTRRRRMRVDHARGLQSVGCMDPAAQTHDSLATSHNAASCAYNVTGCTESTALNFVPTATSSTQCVGQVRGCTIANVTLNFEPAANVLDHSCVYVRYGCSDPSSPSFNSVANVDDGSCAPPHVVGCTDHKATNYNPSATATANCTYGYIGCNDPAAINYDSAATFTFEEFLMEHHMPARLVLVMRRDTTCKYARVGCMAAGAANYDPVATVDDRSCVMTLPEPSSPPSPSTPLEAAGAVMGGAPTIGDTQLLAIVLTSGLVGLIGLLCCGYRHYRAKRRQKVILEEWQHRPVLGFSYEDDPTFEKLASIPPTSTRPQPSRVSDIPQLNEMSPRSGAIASQLHFLHNSERKLAGSASQDLIGCFDDASPASTPAMSPRPLHASLRSDPAAPSPTKARAAETAETPEASRDDVLEASPPSTPGQSPSRSPQRISATSRSDATTPSPTRTRAFEPEASRDDVLMTEASPPSTPGQSPSRSPQRPSATSRGDATSPSPTKARASAPPEISRDDVLPDAEASPPSTPGQSPRPIWRSSPRILGSTSDRVSRDADGIRTTPRGSHVWI